MKVNADIWGPYYWFFLHTISLHYPSNPNETIKKKYFDFINNFYLFIPDNKISNEFQTLLSKYPVSPFLDTKKSFIHWVHFIHNKINQHLGKSTTSLKDFYIEYYEQTKPKQAKDILYKKLTNKILFFCFIFILIGSIVFLYHI